MAPDRGQLEADILQFVQSRCPQYAAMTPDTDLLETGLLDSLLLVDLIFQIEDRYALRFESDHVSPSNFRSVTAVINLVMGQLQPGDAARSDAVGSASGT